MKKHLTYKDGKSDKFWSIETSGASFTVMYGKTGTAGQSSTKEFDTEEKCLKEAEKLVSEKVKKGYNDSVDTPTSITISSDTRIEEITYKEVLNGLIKTNDLKKSIKEHFSYLVQVPSYDEALQNICDRLYSVIVEERAEQQEPSLSIKIFGDNEIETLKCTPPINDLAKVKGWPDSFKEIVNHHESLWLENSNLFLGKQETFDPNYLDDANSQWLQLTKAKNIKSPLGDSSDWYLYHPKKRNKSNEPSLHFFSHEGGDVVANGFEDGVAALFLKRFEEIIGKSNLPISSPIAREHERYVHETKFSKTEFEIKEKSIIVRKEKRGVVESLTTELFSNRNDAIIAFGKKIADCKQGNSVMSYEDRILTIETADNPKEAFFNHFKFVCDNETCRSLLKEISNHLFEVQVTKYSNSDQMYVVFLLPPYQLNCIGPIAGDSIKQYYSHFDNNLKQIKRVHSAITLMSADGNDYYLRMSNHSDLSKTSFEDVYRVFKKIKASGHIFSEEEEKYALTIKEIYDEIDLKGKKGVFYELLSIDNFIGERKGISIIGYPRNGIVYYFYLFRVELFLLNNPESLLEYTGWFKKYCHPLHGNAGDLFIQHLAKVMGVSNDAL